jgi:hypothetical protein
VSEQIRFHLDEHIDPNIARGLSANQGIPIGKLVPFRTASNRRASLGEDRGKFIVPEDFNDPLPKEILAAFEGNEE